MKQNLHVVVLAAGKGKRMVSELPKVLHPVLFQPMIHHVLDVAFSLPGAKVCAVIGHGGERVKEACRNYSNLAFAEQKEQRGTAHAVGCARSFFEGAEGTVLILSGDVILLRRQTLVELIERHLQSKAACTVVTARVDNPKGYGRILRKVDSVVGIREEVDCDEDEQTLNEVNAGVYCFRADALVKSLGAIRDQNRQKEFYLTDAIGFLASQGETVEGFGLEDAREMLGINDRIGLAEVEGVLQRRINRFWMQEGVTIHSPATVCIDARSRIAPDVQIEPGCILVDSRIGPRSVLEAYSRLMRCEVAEDSVIRQGSYLTDSTIGARTSVGPYAHLRPGSVLEQDVKIGNFVEIKKSKFGAGSKASHLSYIGDAEIGARVNIGCGFVTCNFDGGAVKHKTIIEDDVFVGSDSQTIAPVRIGRGAYVASGTTVTLDVPADALAVSRVKQSNKEGYGARLRRKASTASDKKR